MNINNLITVHGNQNLRRDPNTRALLNCNYDKLENSKSFNNINDKYNVLENKINTIDKNLDEIKIMLKVNLILI